MKTRHVWVLPVYDVGHPRQGLVLDWRQRPRLASPATWEAQVVYVDTTGVTRVEWVASSYLRPVTSTPPTA